MPAMQAVHDNSIPDSHLPDVVAPLRVAEDLATQPDLDVELLMSTHLTVVVRARVEFEDADAAQDTGIVIARRRCDGKKPSGRVLAEAARECAMRLALRAGSVPRSVRRLWVRVNGRWQALLDGGAVQLGWAG